MKLSYLASVALVVVCPASALAQGAPAPAASQPATSAPAPAAKPILTAGTKVYGPQGEEVGTIASISGDNVVLDTGTNKATLAAASFGSGAQGPVIGMTKAQLDAAVQQATSQASAAKEAALVPGTEVKSKDGVVVGKVDKVDGDNVVVARAAGPVTLSKANIASGPDGGLSLAMTAAEFDGAAKAAGAGATTQDQATETTTTTKTKTKKKS